MDPDNPDQSSVQPSGFRSQPEPFNFHAVTRKKKVENEKIQNRKKTVAQKKRETTKPPPGSFFLN